MYNCLFKRIFDVFISSLSILALFPLLTIVSIVIKFDSSGPVLFVQKRLGLNQRHFSVFKFRTMLNKDRDYEEQVYKDNHEITRIGYYLRRYKIDELPQIFNVLIGDMSIVGPRPSLPRIAEKFNLDPKLRYSVKPGLTSLAGVNGSIYLTWEEKWWYDEYYVKNVSLLLDLSIILKTVLVVILGENKFLRKPNL